jgi:hypothetical protein
VMFPLIVLKMIFWKKGGYFVTLLLPKNNLPFCCFKTPWAVHLPFLFGSLIMGSLSCQRPKTDCSWVVMVVSYSIHKLMCEVYRFIRVSLWEKLHDISVTSALTSEDGECRTRKGHRRRVIVFLYADDA